MHLDEYLFRKKLWATDFAKLIDYSASHIRGYLQGQHRASKKLAKKIQEATNGEVTISEILEKNPSKNKKVLFKNEEL